jgi:hypothetical protein
MQVPVSRQYRVMKTGKKGSMLFSVIDPLFFFDEITSKCCDLGPEEIMLE